MTLTLKTLATPLADADLPQHNHLLVLLPPAEQLPAGLPGKALLQAAQKRQGSKPGELAKAPLVATLPHGGLIVWAMVDASKGRFEQLSQLRKALTPLLEEHPKALAISLHGGVAWREAVAPRAAYVAMVNGEPLPHGKSKNEKKPLARLDLFGWEDAHGHLATARAAAAGNLLTRELTVLPPNTLTPAAYRRRIKALAGEHGWGLEEFDVAKLKKIGAGAFVAVAQGSEEQDAAIVHLSYVPKRAQAKVALVGKGICFDTGGHNLKPARYMAGMHEDMNGSAVALGLLLAITQQKLPLRVDVWLALAKNEISPRAYRQGDIVTALNGTTIEVVHTDAEGRMVLADTLTLAAGHKLNKAGKPDLMIDFATLTGSMTVALGTRYSGVFASEDALGEQAVDAGRDSGERVCLFPLPEDYDPELDSKVADIKQCTLDGEADHILAARFLKRFTDERPWLHVDLSAAGNKGGLGAVASEQTGFGVAWGLTLLQRWAGLQEKPAPADKAQKTAARRA